ncbi:hypothetical protein Tco_1163467 [Tanacetum coccineum]
MSQQLQTLTEQLQQQKQRLDDLMTFKVPDAIEESVVAHIINEVKNQLLKVVPDVRAGPLLFRTRIHSMCWHVLRTIKIRLTTSPSTVHHQTSPFLELDCTNTITLMSKTITRFEGEINLALYKALCYSVAQDKRISRKESCKDANLKKRPHDYQDPPENPKGGRSIRNKEWSIVVVYDEDAELGIHHWPELRKGFYKTKNASITREDVHSNSKIVNVMHIEKDDHYEDPYDDDEFDDPGLTPAQMRFVDAFDISLRGQLQ